MQDDRTNPPRRPFFARARNAERGMTSVEYAVISVVMIVTIIATVLWLVNPADLDNSLLPKTYSAVGQKVGNFGLVNLPGN